MDYHVQRTLHQHPADADHINTNFASGTNFGGRTLADYLSVTPQAVSRWENGGGYPDIELLPAIATFFDVSLDVLMGVDLSKAKQDMIVVRLAELLKGGEFSKVIQDGKEAISMFPSNCALLMVVSSAIIAKYASKHIKIDIDERKHMLEEALSYSRRIIDDSTDSDIILSGKYTALTILRVLDRNSEATDIAASLPPAVYAKENSLCVCLTGDKRLDYLREQLPMIIGRFTGVLNLIKYPDKDENRPIVKYSFEDCERLLKIWDAAYDNGNADFDAVKKKCMNYLLLNLYAAKTSYINGDSTIAKQYLKTALECAELIDASDEALLDTRCNAALKCVIANDPDCTMSEEDVLSHNVVYIIKNCFTDSGFFQGFEI